MQDEVADEGEDGVQLGQEFQGSRDEDEDQVQSGQDVFWDEVLPGLMDGRGDDWDLVGMEDICDMCTRAILILYEFGVWLSFRMFDGKLRKNIQT